MCFVVPSRITRVISSDQVEIDRLGERLVVSTVLLDEPPAPGDWVAVQAQRQAVAILSPEEAGELLALYAQIRQLQESAAP